MADPNNRVVPLDAGPEFQVALGNPDVRGWDVIAADGWRVGKVSGLLVDPTAMKVRYLDVDVDSVFGNTAGAQHVLVPVRYADLNRRATEVRVDAIRSSDLSTLPAYQREPLTPEYEIALQERWKRGGADGGASRGS